MNDEKTSRARQIKINEIFHSIQGESSYVGCRTVFIRTTGCHLRCTYCDTKYSYYDGEWMNLDQILENVASYQTPYVCITGGEPLLQKPVFELVHQLCEKEFRVSVETSGDKSCEGLDSRAKVILDIKTPDSGEAGKFFEENLKMISSDSEIKFVICSERDLEWAENFCKEHELFTNHKILYSPSFGQIDNQWLAEQIISRQSLACMQVQLHKYIWPAHKRGV